MKILVIFLSCSLLGISAGYRVRRSDSSSDEKEVKEEEKEVSAEEDNFSGESETYNCKDLTQSFFGNVASDAADVRKNSSSKN
jgi:hypothetical protein